MEATNNREKIKFDIKSEMIYLLYNVDVSGLLDTKNNTIIPEGITEADLDKLRERGMFVEPKKVPGFYTKHYREEHTPYTIETTPPYDEESFLSIEQLKTIPFFQSFTLGTDLSVKWDIEVYKNGLGLIVIKIGPVPPQDWHLGYRLGCLYLNPFYKVIATAPVAYLWGGSPPEDFINIDELASSIFEYTFKDLKRRERFRALTHEVQIPIIVIDVEVPEEVSQEQFINENSEMIASYVFRPMCWEVEKMSNSFIQKLISKEKRWSVSNRSFLIASYEGAIIVNLIPKGCEKLASNSVSNFYIAHEKSILHTYFLVISNYHHVRLIDDALDKVNKDVIQTVTEFQRQTRLRQKSAEITAINEFLVRIANFRYLVKVYLEEIRNSDKLIDEEFHIELFNTVSEALGLEVWYSAIEKKMDDLAQLLETVETIQTRISHTIQESTRSTMEFVESFVFFEAIFSFLALLIVVLYDPDVPLLAGFHQFFPPGLDLLVVIFALLALPISAIVFFQLLIKKYTENQLRQQGLSQSYKLHEKKDGMKKEDI